MAQVTEREKHFPSKHPCTYIKHQYSSNMVAEHGPDAPLPQMAEQLLEVPKFVPQDRILQQTVEQFADRSEAKRADLAKAEQSLAALMASQAAGKSSCNQVALDHLREGLRRGVEGVDRGNASAPIRDG